MYLAHLTQQLIYYVTDSVPSRSEVCSVYFLKDAFWCLHSYIANTNAALRSHWDKQDLPRYNTIDKKVAVLNASANFYMIIHQLLKLIMPNLKVLRNMTYLFYSKSTGTNQESAGFLISHYMSPKLNAELGNPKIGNIYINF